MKTSRFLGLLLALVLLSGLVSAAAEDTARFQQVFSEASITSTDAVADGHRVLVVSNRERKYGLMDDTGAVLVPLQYESRISHVAGAFFSVRSEDDGEDAINTLALIDAKGSLLTEYAYGDFVAVDENWVLGVQLQETTGEPYDYSGLFGGKYLISGVDVFNFARDGKAGALTRDQYKRAKAVGESHLLVADRNDQVQLYDSALQPVESTFTSLYDEEIYVADVNMEKCAVSRATGETIARGVDRVNSISRSGLFWARPVGGSAWGLMDRTGDFLSAVEYDSTYSANYGGYMKVSRDNKIGLLSLENGQLAVPCQYDDVLYGYTSNSYVNNGYAAVVSDGKVGFVDLEGNVTCEPRYAKSAVTVLGCTLYAADMDGTVTVVAADGTVSRGLKALKEYGCSGDGYFLSVQGENDLWGIVDWHGEEVVPCQASSNYTVRGSDLVIYNDTLYRLVR